MHQKWRRNWALNAVRARDETTQEWVEVLSGEVYVTLEGRKEDGRLRIFLTVRHETKHIMINHQSSVRHGHRIVVTSTPNDGISTWVLTFLSDSMAEAFDSAVVTG